MLSVRKNTKGFGFCIKKNTQEFYGIQTECCRLQTDEQLRKQDLLSLLSLTG